MTYLNRNGSRVLWWDLFPSVDHPTFALWLTLRDSQLDAVLYRILKAHYLECPYADYGVAADYIEDHWDRLLSVAQTAEGVDPEPLLRRLVERLRLAFAEGCQ